MNQVNLLSICAYALIFSLSHSLILYYVHLRCYHDSAIQMIIKLRKRDRLLSHMRVRELVRLPRLAAVPFCTLLAAMVKREAFAGEGDPIALLGLQAMAAAWELAVCWLSLFLISSFIS